LDDVRAPVYILVKLRSKVITVIDVDAVRGDTPGCHERLHFNNAGASLMPRSVVDTMVEHLELEARLGGYEAADRAREAIAAVYASAARLLNCDPAEIAQFENATRAWDAVLYSIPFTQGDRILTGRAEYCSNYMAFLQVARATGAEIVVIGDDEHGQIDVEQLGAVIDERAKLIALTHVPTSGGLVNPAAAVGRVAQAAGVLYLLDACQSVGQLPIDVQAVGCDFLSTTGRKFLRGPRGTGFLYGNRERISRLHPPVVDVRAADWVAIDDYRLQPDARRFETWEVSYACQLGLGRAIDYALDQGLDAIWTRVQELGSSLRAQLADLPGVTVHDLGATKCGIVTFTLAGLGADQIKAELTARRVNVEVTSVADTRLDLEARGLDRMVRASVHYFNTEDEIGRFCALIATLA
jgi:cysteine desulfurase/selenocysteine lyase